MLEKRLSTVVPKIGRKVMMRLRGSSLAAFTAERNFEMTLSGGGSGGGGGT